MIDLVIENPGKGVARRSGVDRLSTPGPVAAAGLFYQCRTLQVRQVMFMDDTARMVVLLIRDVAEWTTYRPARRKTADSKPQ